MGDFVEKRLPLKKQSADQERAKGHGGQQDVAHDGQKKQEPTWRFPNEKTTMSLPG